MRRITTLTGAGKLRTVDRDLGDVDYEIVVWREPRGWKLADGSLVADGPAIVSAFHSNAQVLLDLETGEHLMIEVTQASMAKGQFVVSGPMPRSRQPAKIKATSMTAAKVKAVRQVAG
jgi:hypothetical protein